MKVLLLTRYGRLGVTSRIRFLQYLPYLESQGVAVDVAPFLEDDYVSSLYKGHRSWKAILNAYVRRLSQLTRVNQYDLLWIEKELLPWFPALAERFVHNYVVDYDDAVFHAYDRHSNPLVRAMLSRKIGRVMAMASTVVVGNRYLGDYAQSAGARSIEYVPTVIDLDRYGPITESANPVFTIGWIGTPWTARYLPAIQRPLEEVCRNGQARMVLIGSGPVNLGAVPVEVLPWSEETEVPDMRRCDIGIMPLPDEPYERGKCGYKLLQYMACGRPVIASPVGANKEIVESGVSGYLAGTNTEWIESIDGLRRDGALLTAMGRAARAKVEAHYSLERHAPRILEILKKACY